MKILAIHIKNLASLEGVTEIDFTVDPLCSAGIFAITGPTGSGKSTILDAICLALYGKTPRYIQAKETGIELDDIPGSKITQGDVKGILRDGTGDGYAEVHFVGTDGKKYKASWQVKRAYGKIDGALQSEIITLSDLETNTIISSKKTEVLPLIEKLVGLNFEQFTRSVLLAQGDFTAFLKANKDEKSTLLEKLTGNFVYSQISIMVYEKWRKAEQDLKELNIQKEGILILSDEDLSAIALQQQTLNQQVVGFEKLVKGLDKEYNWHNRLIELNTGVNSAKSDCDLSVANKTGAIPRSQRLLQVTAVQPVRSFYDTKEQASTQRVNVTGQLDLANQKIHQLSDSKNELDGSLKTCETNFNDAKKARQVAGPLIEQAKKKDILINEKYSQIAICQKDIDDAISEITTHDIKLKLKQLEANKFKEDIKELEAWKGKYQYRQPIADNIKLISSKLTDADKALALLKTSQSDLETNIEELGALESEWAGLKTDMADADQQLKTNSSALKAEQKLLAEIDINIVQKDKQAIDTEIEDAISGIGQWKLYYHASTEKQQLSDRSELNKIELNKKQGLVNAAKTALDNVKLKRDTTGKLLEKAKLTVVESVESLRSMLVEGEACLVCGSIEHPYQGNSRVLNDVMDGLEAEYRQIEIEYEDNLNNNSVLQEAIQSLTKQIKTDSEQLIMKTKSTEQLGQSWQNFKIKKRCEQIADALKEKWLGDALNDLKSKQSDLQKQIDKHSQLKQKVEKILATTEEMKSNLNKLTDSFKDKSRKKESLTEAGNQLSQRKKSSENDLAALQKELAPYFENKEWFNSWQENAESFVNQINDFADQWSQKNQRLETEKQQESVCLTALEGLITKATHLAGNKKKYTDALSVLNSDMETLRLDRNALFEGEKVDEVEKRFDAEVTNAQEIFDKLKLQLQNTEKDLAVSKTQASEFSKESERLLKIVDSNTTRIADWLLKSNSKQGFELSENDLNQLLGYDNEWIDSERQWLKEIEDAVTKNQSIYSERNKQLDTHLTQKISDRTLQEVRDQLAESKANLESATQARSENYFKLQQDSVNKEKIADLLVKIKDKASVLENWSKLNEMIGSADGKKFRQIAQEFTLDVLLAFANIHMQMLSKRYVIQRIGNTLGLQVIDKDMGDEIRTVYSLSGGESFLVSLALALGLAELSSSKMNVESLFIDEGFGSLDPITLTIAMGALEGLHNQGRKVGVISHVQEMTERIPTQIQVTKYSNGKSKVTVAVL